MAILSRQVSQRKAWALLGADRLTDRFVAESVIATTVPMVLVDDGIVGTV